MVVWNTGSAAARFRAKNKKKKKLQAPSTKPQASSNKPQAVFHHNNEFLTQRQVKNVLKKLALDKPTL